MRDIEPVFEKKFSTEEFDHSGEMGLINFERDFRL